MIANAMNNWLHEALEKASWKIYEETNISYMQVAPIVNNEYNEICKEVARKNMKRKSNALLFTVWVIFYLSLGFVFNQVSGKSLSSFLIIGFFTQSVVYFSALLMPFFKNLAKNTSTQTVTSVSNVLFSLRRYLIPGLHIVQMVSDFVLKTASFWAVNGLLYLFGVEYLGFVTALCFGAFMSIFFAITMYSAGKKYYQRIKGTVSASMT